MKKIACVSTDDAKLDALLAPYAAQYVIDDKNPEYVIAFGGDGTLMRAEHRYPGVPKLLLRNSRIAKLAHAHNNEAVLEAFFNDQHTIEEHSKLRISTPHGSLEALNDVIVHNADPRYAIRYHIALNDEPIHHEIIGDGVVCATPLGSTGYYRSITDNTFTTGIGLAFNNSVERVDHIVAHEDTVLAITIARGPAVCYADNQDDFFQLVDGDIVHIQKSENIAKIVRVHA